MNSWEQHTETDAAAGLRAAPHVASGRWVVLGMFGFGIVATAGLWFYWELHTRPFRPLQEALVRTFPGSNPRVQGGQEKIHKGTPRILQIVMRVDFDPVGRESEAQRVAAQAAELARRYQDLDQYQWLEVGLFQPLSEQDPRMRTIRISVDESPAGE